MKAKHKQNLLALAEIVASLEPEQFDIRRVNECNSVGCCVGWAACHPHFQKQGLSFHECSDSRMSVVLWHSNPISNGWQWDGGSGSGPMIFNLFGVKGRDPLSRALADGNTYPFDRLLDRELDFLTPATAAQSILDYIEARTGETWELVG
jgi:hypothetical protein